MSQHSLTITIGLRDPTGLATYPDLEIKILGLLHIFLKGGGSTLRRYGVTTISYFGPPKDDLDKGSAMGAFHGTIVDSLMSRNDVLLQYIEVGSLGISRPSVSYILRGLSKLAREAMLLIIGNRSKITLMSYPSIPLVPLTSFMKLPVALFSYLVWFIKRHLTGQRFVLIVADLPLEQSEDLGIALGIRPRFYRIFESLLFHSASHIVVPSDAIGEYIASRYRVSRDRLHKYRVYAYTAPSLVSKNVSSIAGLDFRLRFLYAGDLRRSQDRENILRVCDLIKKHPLSHLVICGPGGAFLGNKVAANIEYKGVLDRQTLDAVAASCHVGLILYPTSRRYYHWAPTLKYSMYIANGLAVLSTRLETIEKNLRQDSVGLASEWQDLYKTLEEWMEHPELGLPFKKAAERMSVRVGGDFFIREWLDPILREIGECGSY